MTRAGGPLGLFLHNVNANLTLSGEDPPVNTGYDTWMTGRGYAPATISKRMFLYRHLLDRWGTLDVPPDRIAEFLGTYRGWSHRTYHGHLISLYEWLVETGQIDTNRPRTIKRAPTPRPHPSPLSEGELRRALVASRPRTRAFLMLGYLAGLRRAEIACFHGRQINATSLYVTGKGGYGWALPTHPLLWGLAREYPRDGYWFPSRAAGYDHVSPATVGAVVGSLFRSLGYEGATHRTRHTFGTHLLRGGANLRVVQELLRHQSLATTALYLGVDDVEKTTAIRGLGAA